MELRQWIEARIAALPEETFDSLDDWPENAETFDPALPGAFTALLEPVILSLEYRSAAGEVTERRVTALQLKGTAEGPLHLVARCHTRKAQRTFRVDRILSLSGLPDMPAEATPADLLAALVDLAIETEWHEGKQPPLPRGGAGGCSHPLNNIARSQSSATPFGVIRKRFRAEIRLLAFLAKSDGELHPAELAAINSYCEGLAGTVHLIWGEAEGAALAKYCRELQFSPKVEMACLDKLQRDVEDWAARFDRAAATVMEADGRIAPEEVTMLQRWGVQPDDYSFEDDDGNKASPPIAPIAIVLGILAIAILAIFLG